MVNPTTFYRQPLLTSSTESELDNCDEGNDDGDDCDGEGEITVSYTHLTLPTILLV